MYCPECGFHNSDAHKYCGRCGALLIAENQGTGEITGPLAISDEDGRDRRLAGPGDRRPHAGGPRGRAARARSSRSTATTVTIGREPTSDVFLDDVTVSRNHAVILRAGDGSPLRDLGSLNGTYVNRRRIESDEVLEDGDELQIGKFRLTYLAG